MSFTIDIGNTEKSAKEVRKSPTWSYKLEGTLKAECDIKKPVIALRIGDTPGIKIPDITKCNYAYIPNFNRYYFISDFKTVRNVILEIYMDEDYLMSFSSEIYKQKAIVVRTESTAYYTSDLEDPDVYRYAEDNIVVKKLSSTTGFTKTAGSYVMVTAGPSAAV